MHIDTNGSLIGFSNQDCYMKTILYAIEKANKTGITVKRVHVSSDVFHVIKNNFNSDIIININPFLQFDEFILIDV